MFKCLSILTLFIVSSISYATCTDSSVKGIYEFDLQAQRYPGRLDFLPSKGKYTRRFNIDGDGTIIVSKALTPSGEMRGEEGIGFYEVSEDCFLKGEVIFNKNSILKIWIDLEDPGKNKLVKFGQVETNHIQDGIKSIGPMVWIEKLPKPE